MLELENCKLCSWECGVDRLAGELGVCQIEEPLVASCQLHPAPPQSYTVFTAGCNFKCLNCQNWEIAHYPVTGVIIRGAEDPENIAVEGVAAIHSTFGELIRADRLFFSGGSPTVALPWIEEVVAHAQKLDPEMKVNFDTNGFPTKSSFRRILDISDSITFDIKAINNEVHRAITGAPVEPVLRNAEEMARKKEKLWEYRILVIPEIVDTEEIQAICEFLVGLDETLPVSFLAFRPNYCLDTHLGAPRELMDQCVTIARRSGLENVKWAGHTDLKGTVLEKASQFKTEYSNTGTEIAMRYATRAKCVMKLRNCGKCEKKHSCELKIYSPTKIL
jgi:pyruvate formate lyase activating enzyme